MEGVDEQVLKMADAIRQLEEFNSKMKEANDLIDRLASKGLTIAAVKPEIRIEWH